MINRPYKIMLHLLLITIAFISVRASWRDNPILNGTEPEMVGRIAGLRQRVLRDGCSVNLCFALQGDDFISDDEYEAQKNFADLIVAIVTTDIDRRSTNFCAVQYGFLTRPISRLTNQRNQFLRRLRRSRRAGGDATNIAAALGYTGFQLRRREGDANKVVLFGDGLDTDGFAPEFVVDRLRENDIELCAVAVGESLSLPRLREIVGGSPNKVVQIDDFFDLADVVFEVVFNVCGYFEV